MNIEVGSKWKNEQCELDRQGLIVTKVTLKFVTYTDIKGYFAFRMSIKRFREQFYPFPS